MARKRLKKGSNFGSKSSRYVQKIWAKSNKSSQMIREATTKTTTTQPIADDHDNGMAKQDEGVSIFQKAALPTSCPDHGLVSRKEYEGGWDQHLYSDSYPSLFYEHPSSSLIYGDNGHHLVQSDCSLTGAFTTVTAEPQDLFSSTAWNESFGGWENTSYVSKRGLFQPLTTASSLFDAANNSSSYDPQSGQFEGCPYVADGQDEEDFFDSFNLPCDNNYAYDEKEEYSSQIDGDLLRDLSVLHSL